jgi:hypothetical protein
VAVNEVADGIDSVRNGNWWQEKIWKTQVPAGRNKDWNKEFDHGD